MARSQSTARRSSTGGGHASSAYVETLARLSQRRRFGMRPGLEVIRALLGALDHPEASFRSLHITGSKGKGSVAAISAKILESAGRRVGLFTSPHLLSYRERIRIGGTPIARTGVVEGIRRIETEAASLLAAGTIEREPTFFEVTTALAFDAFRSAHVDDAVIEVGIGGRLDSTNVIDAAVGVITTIELEHTDVLGPTLADIAHEKAGILHRGMRAVVGALPAAARAVVDREADALGVPVAHLGEEIRTGERTLFDGGQRFSIGSPSRPERAVEIPLFGRFQADNAALAVAAVEEYARLLGVPLPDAAVERGLADVRWRGRLERIGRRPEAFLDVAHTPESARAVAESLAEILPFADPAESAVVLGCLSDKRAGPILEALAPLARTLVAVPVRSARSADTGELRRAATGKFPRIVVAPTATQGFELARGAVGTDGLLLVTGSDYLVGEILEHLEGRPAGEPDLSDPGLSTGTVASATLASPRPRT